MTGWDTVLTMLPTAAGFMSLLMAFIVFSAGKERYRFSFTIFSVAMGIWGILISSFLVSDDIDRAAWIVRIYYVAAALLIYGFVVFCAELTKRITLFSVSSLSVAMILISALSFVPGALFEMVSSTNDLRVQLHSVPYFFYALYFITMSVLAFYYLLTAKHRDIDTRGKLQAKLILIVMSVCLPLGALFNLVLPLVGNYDLIMIGPLFALPIVAVVFYGIARYGLFDVKLAVVRTVVYLLSIVTLATIYIVLAFLISQTVLLGNSESASALTPTSVLLAVFLVFVFQPIKSFFDKATNTLFFRDRYDPEKFYAVLTNNLSRSNTLHQLLASTSRQIAETMKSRHAYFFVFTHDRRRVTVGTSHHRNLPMEDIRQLQVYIDEHGTEIISVDALPIGDELHRMLISYRIGLVLPLVRDTEAFGFLFLGEQQENGFSEQDMRVLSTVREELVIAIQNALSVQEVRDINENLEQRIEAATAELRSSNARLTRLDAAKDEFLSMASHQLRTPLTSIKGYLSMVLEGDVGKVSENQKKVLEEAYSSSERMVHLIHDFLNVSRLQTGKFMLEVAQTDIVKLVRQELKSLESSASSHDLTFEFVTKLKKEEIKIDDTKIRQVVMNYIDNAIFYSRPGTNIVVELAKRKGEILFSVKDTGIGVPKAEQDKLFEKFYRATNARRQRPDGTGVGLYLAKTVITAHGGEVIFSSIEGKGSTFGFKLPIENDAILEKYSQQLKQ